MNIVFVSSEVSPFAKTGGLGDVCGALPRALERLGHQVTIFTPLHRTAQRYCEVNGIELVPVTDSFLLRWAGWAITTRLFRAQLPGSDVPVIFVASGDLFDREAIYSPSIDGRDDNVFRFTVFCRAVIRGCELLDITPDIVHAHDWHTALLPVYLHSGLRGDLHFAKASSVFTIHNLNYQGRAPSNDFSQLGLWSGYWASDSLEYFGELNLMKGGIVFADRVTTVSPGYAREVQYPQFGAGLDGLLRDQSWKFSGILNGIDVEEWNPATDEHLAANFSPGRMNGKTISKRMLSKEAGIKSRPKTPLLAVVSRFAEQKGLDLVLSAGAQLITAGAQLLVLGTGDRDIEEGFRALASRYPSECAVWLGFDEGLAHRIYAGADILLMPSRYEPCGLNQMYALHYGTLPVVRLTGGLADTVTPFDGTNHDHANGFGFYSTNAQDLYLSTWIAMLNYRDSRLWKRLQQRGMGTDFSWEASALEYEKVYRLAAARG
ncbi:MAG TPA: glycogen synthase GlgA [Thermoanaerobaculia bacterium]|nr:glycogen synthase GlgA [Thermoanaerobaculia bacterium]